MISSRANKPLPTKIDEAAVVSRLLQDDLLTQAANDPERIALIVGDVRMRYGEVAHYACRLAHALRQRGVRRGDRVVIFMSNTWHCAVSIYAVLLAGAVFVPVNAQTKADKLAFILADTDARLLLTEANLARIFTPAVQQQPQVRVLCAGHAKLMPTDVEYLDDTLIDMPGTPPPSSSIALDLAALLYTSGTTGNPKGVMHSHQSLLFVLDSINQYLKLTADDRLFSFLPLNFGYGLCQWFSAVHVGATLVLEQSFTYPAQVFNRMQVESVTCFAGVPTVFAMMLTLDAKQPLSFASVRRVTSAAAALPVEFIAGIRKIFPQADLFNMYGQTECIRIAYLEPDQLELKPDSVGCAIPGTELLLLDEQGHPVVPGEVGYLHVRGQHLMRGYWHQPDKTAEVLLPAPIPGENLLKTGDLFRQDADGYFYFVGRSDDIITSRGEKVSPTEVENAIYSLPAVHEVVVLGIPDPLSGHAVCAFVAARQGEPLSEQQIKNVCVTRLENYMVPKHILMLPELPHTDNGKLSRQLILQQCAELISQLD
ncbi:class I adenylate-forming enzyme family protein [Methylococcus sp. Mc7]|uniref:class I adenylate-forming enzyme family protein n=1 Tax=Methylococcus sp. Mc7 TaxID=2860258 RepID=UPI001C53138E|nr:class I adenylate-forming enzyme family protein [Methylococcus sp. Mc7]QXP84193.1 acyl--CoA ligase [Methylococcus sp. Mc7]